MAICAGSPTQRDPCRRCGLRIEASRVPSPAGFIAHRLIHRHYAATLQLPPNRAFGH
ncbi:hypothetical protein [Lysobacter gummosus]|uniref:hypothetical protein n=1 Tax=Lysobacter gummosus TaxID=262324 RepID=UPI0036362863